MSTHKGHEEVIPAALDKKMDVVLMSYNFTMGDRMEPLLASLHEAGVGVVAMKTQAGGRGEEARARHDKLVASGGMVAALRWALRTPNVHTTIPSITDQAMLDENIQAMSAPFRPRRRGPPRRPPGGHPPPGPGAAGVKTRAFSGVLGAQRPRRLRAHHLRS